MSSLAEVCAEGFPVAHVSLTVHRVQEKAIFSKSFRHTRVKKQSAASTLLALLC